MTSELDLLFAIHDGLPRQGPGDDASTRKALSMIEDLPDAPRILDVGCGCGMQTLVLAEAAGGHVTAVDLFRGYLDELDRRAAAAGLADRITTRKASMEALDFPESSFDLIWSEGAIFIIGFAAGLAAWRPLLADGGYLALTEACWFRENPPGEVRAFWSECYPPMRDRKGNLDMIERAGYRMVDHFDLPRESWWTHYYTPLRARLPDLKRRYAGDAVAENLLAFSETEMDMHERYGEWYGYTFFIMKKG